MSYLREVENLSVMAQGQNIVIKSEYGGIDPIVVQRIRSVEETRLSEIRTALVDLQVRIAAGTADRGSGSGILVVPDTHGCAPKTIVAVVGAWLAYLGVQHRDSAKSCAVSFIRAGAVEAFFYRHALEERNTSAAAQQTSLLRPRPPLLSLAVMAVLYLSTRRGSSSGPIP